MSKIRALTDKRAARIREAEELRGKIVDGMADADVADINAKFDACMGEADALQAEIDREQRLDAAKRGLSEARDRRQAGREDDGEERGERGGEGLTREQAFRSFLRVGLGNLTPEARSALRGSAVAREDVASELRAQGIATSAAGGYTVPSTFSAELIKAMADYGPMMNPGLFREYNTGSGSGLSIPTTDDTSKVGTAASENTVPTSEGDIVFGAINLSAYKAASGPVLVSDELISDSGIDVEAEVISLMAERLGRKANAWLTTGTGSSQPQGIVVGSALGKTAASATAITADELLDLYHSVDPAYRASRSCGFMFNDNTLKTIRKLKDAENRYLIGDLADTEGEISFAGIRKRYFINQGMADIATGQKTVLFGDMRKYARRQVRDISIIRLNERYADAGQVGFIGWMRLDGRVLDTRAIKHLIQA